MKMRKNSTAYTHTITDQIPPELRLDRYVSENLGLLSRSQIKTRQLKAKINGKDAKLSRHVKTGDALSLCWEEEPPAELIPQDIPLDIIYEDDNCIVINKAQGMVVHPGAGNKQGTLANAIYHRILNKKGTSLPAHYTAPQVRLHTTHCQNRPGIVHRLDKDTSGIIIAAFNNESHAFLSQQFKTRKVKKTYIALIAGVPKDIKGKIETCISRDPKNRKRFTVSEAGRNAVTYYKVAKTFNDFSLVLLRPETGRTHQLRVHMKHIGHPVLGDSLYGNTNGKFRDASLMLHSKTLSIILPGETEERIFTTPVPRRFFDIVTSV